MSEIPDTPFKRATQKRRSMKSESEGAAMDGGRTQPNSGARWNAKGDYRGNGFLVDDKFTDARSYLFKLDGPQGLEAHITNARQTPPGLLPAWRISLPGVKLRVVIEEDFLYLVAKAEAPDAAQKEIERLKAHIAELESSHDIP